VPEHPSRPCGGRRRKARGRGRDAQMRRIKRARARPILATGYR
jgi:hypothetical protein